MKRTGFGTAACALLAALLLASAVLPPHTAAAQQAAAGWWQVMPSGISATSWIEGKDPTSWMPNKMADGREDTSWQFSVRQSPLGGTYAYIWFTEPAQVDELWIKNGFWKYTNGLDQYTRNSRIQSLDIDYRYAGREDYADGRTFWLTDDAARRDWQRLTLTAREPVTAIRLRILGIYEGSKYPTDVCVSELMVVSRTQPSYANSYSAGVPTVYLPGQSASGGLALYALTIDKLATRDGPGTEYAGKGTYSVKGQWIRILAKSYDVNNVCWVQCEIPYRNKTVVAWTGWKRFDHTTLDIGMVPYANGSGAGGSVYPGYSGGTGYSGGSGYSGGTGYSGGSAAAAWQTAYADVLNARRAGILLYESAARGELDIPFTDITNDQSTLLYDINGDGQEELIFVEAAREGAYGEVGLTLHIWTFAGGAARNLCALPVDDSIPGGGFFTLSVYNGAFCYRESFNMDGQMERVNALSMTAGPALVSNELLYYSYMIDQSDDSMPMVDAVFRIGGQPGDLASCEAYINRFEMNGLELYSAAHRSARGLTLSQALSALGR